MGRAPSGAARPAGNLSPGGPETTKAMKSDGVVLLCGDKGHKEASVDDDWMAGVLDRVDERYNREQAERKACAGPFSAIYWLVFFTVGLGVPAVLYHYGPDLAGPIGAVWQNLVERLAG